MTTVKVRTRSDRRAPSIVLGIALFLIAVAVAWWAIWILNGTGSADQTPGAEFVSSELTWGSVALAVLGGVVVVLGVILLIVAMTPGRRKVTRVASSTQVEHPHATLITTRSLARMAIAEAERVEGTVSASASAGPRKVKVQVRSLARDTATVRTQVQEAIQRRLQSPAVSPQPSVSVSVSTKESRS